MSDEDMVKPDKTAVSATASGSAQTTEPPKQQAPRASRLARLKNKIKKIQGKDPDIYPMW
ncbi:hypothetical protein LCL97_12415 [Seohaeicola saemankumensis]|nr:hypothetical protein [Seohaeicola saemankumensis]MCA0871633.1 hypothetical protein [Seohaeicola saemankumensis]